MFGHIYLNTHGVRGQLCRVGSLPFRWVQGLNSGFQIFVKCLIHWAISPIPSSSPPIWTPFPIQCSHSSQNNLISFCGARDGAQASAVLPSYTPVQQLKRKPHWAPLVVTHLPFSLGWVLCLLVQPCHVPLPPPCKTGHTRHPWSQTHSISSFLDSSSSKPSHQTTICQIPSRLCPFCTMLGPGAKKHK